MLKFSRRPALLFKLDLQRRAGYKGYLLMLPCVFLSSMTLVVFWMPPERPDRNTLGMSELLESKSTKNIGPTSIYYMY